MTRAKNQIFPQSAKLSLNFVIVGGGIAGLACAYTLQCAGHNARVLEKNNSIGKMTAGIRSPPNMTRLLLRWGLGEKLKAISTLCTHIAVRLGATAEQLCSVYFHKEVMRELQGNMLLMQYSDLHIMLYELAIDSGATVDFNSEVVSVDSNAPSVLLSSGEEIKADIVLGADGGGGFVRSLVAGKQQTFKSGPFSTYAFIIPVELLEHDDELKKIIINDPWSVFLADGRAIQTNIAGGGKRIAVLYLVNDVNYEAKPGWNNTSLLSEVDFSAFDERLQRLMKLVPCAPLVKHVVQESLESWFHPSKKVLLLGEAAHLSHPASTHCAAMALEDAAVLGSLFSHLQSPHQIPYFFSAFQDLRHPRVQAVISSEWGKVEAVSLPPGEKQRIRDSRLREQGSSGFNISDLGDVPEDYMRKQCEEYKEDFGYDAHDDADNWWVAWGTLLERSMDLRSEYRFQGGIWTEKNDNVHAGLQPLKS